MGDALRAILARSLDWNEAHATFDDAVADFPRALRGVRPPGVPWSAWQLVEHIRIAQHDILEFALPGEYHAMKWPDDYWPADPVPPGDEAWDASVAAVRSQRAELRRLIDDPATDLAARVPHATAGHQTFARAALLVADHNAYHTGQLVLLRRLLGAWPGE
ncbi:MAG TPA: DinB family protein [Longimicrobiales bacterium]